MKEIKNLKIGQAFFFECGDNDQKETFNYAEFEALEVMSNNGNLTLKAINAEGGVFIIRVNSEAKKKLIELKEKQNRDAEKQKEAEAVKKRKEQRAMKKEADAYLLEEAAEERKLKREAKQAKEEERQKGILERKRIREEKLIDAENEKVKAEELRKQRDKERQERIDNYPGIIKQENNS